MSGNKEKAAPEEWMTRNVHVWKVVSYKLSWVKYYVSERDASLDECMVMSRGKWLQEVNGAQSALKK